MAIWVGRDEAMSHLSGRQPGFERGSERKMQRFGGERDRRWALKGRAQDGFWFSGSLMWIDTPKM